MTSKKNEVVKNELGKCQIIKGFVSNTKHFGLYVSGECLYVIENH